MKKVKIFCIVWSTIFLAAGLNDWRHLVLAIVVAIAGLSGKIYTERDERGKLTLFRFEVFDGSGFTIERADHEK